MMNDIKSDVSNAFQQFIQTNALLLSRVWRNCVGVLRKEAILLINSVLTTIIFDRNQTQPGSASAVSVVISRASGEQLFIFIVEI